MDWQLKVGLGVAFIFGALSYAVKDMPHGFAWAGFVAGLLLAAWGLIPGNEQHPVAPSLFIIVSISGVVGGAVWFIESLSQIDAKLSFQKYAIFWVNVDQDAYQIGAVLKFVNLDDKAILIKGIKFSGKHWSFFPRGGYYIKRLMENDQMSELLQDNYIEPAGRSPAYFKIMLPIRFNMTVIGGKAPEFVLRGDWSVAIGNNMISVLPNIYTVYDDFVSRSEWDGLLKSNAKINIDDLNYKTIPPRPPLGAPDKNYLVYSEDKGSTIDNPYFARTDFVKGKNGIMVFVRGKGEPPLNGVWTVLGHTYAEVWSDPEKLKLYNSLFPPGSDGKPQPFGFFAGVETEMAGPLDRPLSAPTTRAADILDFTWPEQSK